MTKAEPGVASVADRLAAPVPHRYAAPAAAVVATLVAVFRLFVPHLLRDHAYSGDIRQHVFWGQRAWGADLLNTDPAARYFASDLASPPLWKVIVPLMGRLGEIQFVAEVAGLLVFLVTCVILYKTARALSGSGWAGVFIIVAVAYADETVQWVTSGLLQRSIALPITALTIYALHGRRMVLLGVCFLACALIYPVAIVSVGGLAAAYEAYRLITDRRLPRLWWAATALGVVSIILVVAFRSPPAEYGPAVTYAQSRDMPSFGPIGRNAFFVEGWHQYWFLHHRTGLRIPLATLLGVLGVIALLAVASGRECVRRLPVLAWLPGVVGLTFFLLAHATLYALYLPNRHVAVTLPLALILTAACLAVTAGGRLADAWRWTHGRRAGVAFGLALLAVAPRVPAALATLRDRGEPTAMATAVAFIRSTPPDTLFAGKPIGEVNFIPLRTGRPVLQNFETAQAYYPDYFHAHIEPRLRDSIDAFYATDWATIDRLADAYGVSAYFFAGHRLQRLPEREPMRTMAIGAIRREAERVGDGNPVTPVMYEPPADRILWWRGDIRIIRVGSGPASYTLPDPLGEFPDLPPVDVRPLLDTADDFSTDLMLF